MDIQFEGYHTFVSLKSGKFVTVSEQELRWAEEDKILDIFPEWQQENIQLAIDVRDHFDEYEDFPFKSDINEQRMMTEF